MPDARIADVGYFNEGLASQGDEGLAEACSHHADGVDLCFEPRFSSDGEVEAQLPAHEDSQTDTFATYGADDHGFSEVHHTSTPSEG